MELGRQFAVITPHQQEDLARRYEAAPAFDNNAVPAYRSMAEETKRQFDQLTAPKSRGGEGVAVTVAKQDPYSGPAELFKDISERHHMGVLATSETGGHPVFSNDENDMFRAVHDYYGHHQTQRGFDRHGEESAYQAHAQMYSPQAQQALATETRGQNAVLVRRGAFPEQKVALIGAERLGAPGGRRSAVLQARQMHQAQGL